MKNFFLFKLVAILLLVILLGIVMHYAQAFLIPITFAALLAILLLPVCRKLEHHGVNRVVSIMSSLLLVFIIAIGVLFLFYSQISEFIVDIDIINKAFSEKLITVQKFIHSKTGFSQKEQLDWIHDQYTKIVEMGTTAAKDFFMSFSSFIVSLGLVFIYTFFFLLYRDRFKVFLMKMFKQEHHGKLRNIITRTKNLILHYLSGLLIALTILSIMNSVGLLALGIRQAIFLGFLAGFLNIIPYVGTMIGGIIPVLVALLFKDSIFYALGVAAILIFNQFIDNNITTPNIVGSHVSVNPLATIMAVLIGGYLWGVAGMILFIPLTGVFKIICDNIEPLEPIGYILGEDIKETSKPNWFKSIFLKK